MKDEMVVRLKQEKRALVQNNESSQKMHKEKIEKLDSNKKEYGYQQAKIVQQLKDRQDYYPKKINLLEVTWSYWASID